MSRIPRQSKGNVVGAWARDRAAAMGEAGDRFGAGARAGAGAKVKAGSKTERRNQSQRRGVQKVESIRIGVKAIELATAGARCSVGNRAVNPRYSRIHGVREAATKGTRVRAGAEVKCTSPGWKLSESQGKLRPTRCVQNHLKKTCRYQPSFLSSFCEVTRVMFAC